METEAAKPITLFFPPLLLLLIAVHRSGGGGVGGDVSIWMGWLRALNAITAMRGAALHPVHQSSRQDGLERGLLSQFTIKKS